MYCFFYIVIRNVRVPFIASRFIYFTAYTFCIVRMSFCNFIECINGPNIEFNGIFYRLSHQILKILVLFLLIKIVDPKYTHFI